MKEFIIYVCISAILHTIVVLILKIRNKKLDRERIEDDIEDLTCKNIHLEKILREFQSIDYVKSQLESNKKQIEKLEKKLNKELIDYLTELI